MSDVREPADDQERWLPAGALDFSWPRAGAGATPSLPACAKWARNKLKPRVIQIVLERILTQSTSRISAPSCRSVWGAGRLDEEIAESDGQIVGVKRSLAHLLDVVEQGGLAAVAAGERLAAWQAEAHRA